MSLQFHFYLHSRCDSYSHENRCSLSLWQCPCNIQGRLLLIIIFNNQIFIRIWFQQAYHAVSQIDSAYSTSHIQCPFLHSVLLFIQIGTRAATFWCGFVNNYLLDNDFKFTFPFSLASSNISSSRKLEYEEEEHHEWLQQWQFQRRSSKENKIRL